MSYDMKMPILSCICKSYKYMFDITMTTDIWYLKYDDLMNLLVQYK